MDRAKPFDIPNRGTGWRLAATFRRRSTGGCDGTIRTSRSSVMPMVRSATAAVEIRHRPCAHRLRSGLPNAG